MFRISGPKSEARRGEEQHEIRIGIVAIRIGSAGLGFGRKSMPPPAINTTGPNVEIPRQRGPSEGKASGERRNGRARAPKQGSPRRSGSPASERRRRTVRSNWRPHSSPWRMAGLRATPGACFHSDRFASVIDQSWGNAYHESDSSIHHRNGKYTLLSPSRCTTSRAKSLRVAGRSSIFVFN